MRIIKDDMIIVGLIEKHNEFYLINIPALWLMTQAFTEKDIIPMAKDVIKTLAGEEYKFKLKIIKDSNKIFIESKQKDFIRLVIERLNYRIKYEK